MSRIYRTTEEQIESVIMTDAKAYTYWTAYYLEIPDLEPTNVIDLRGQFEVNNPWGFAAQVTCFIGRGSSFGGPLPLPVDFAFPVAGADIQPHGHYRDIALAFDTGRAGTMAYSLYVQTASTAVTPTKNYLKLNPGYGGLVAVVF